MATAPAPSGGLAAGFVPVPIEHFGGIVSSWPPEMLDPQLAVTAQNVRFMPGEVASREGLTLAFPSPASNPIIGLGIWQQTTGAEPFVSQRILAADNAMNLYYENPAASGTMTAIPWTGQPATKPASAAMMNAASAYGRVYLAFSDGEFGTGCAHWDGTNLDPVTQPAPPSGATAADSATAGNIAGGLRHAVVMYKCRDGSISAASPPFSFTPVGLLPDPTDAPTVEVQLTNAAASTLPAGTYYIQYTWRNGSGETTASPELSVTVPVAPSDSAYALTIACVNPPPGATEMGIYVSVASLGEKLQFYMTAENGATANLQAPITSTGQVVPSSNNSGRQLTVSSLPIGPANVAARVVAFTVGGGSSSGPYLFIEEAQTVNGISETATVVNDNVTTSATFNFDDAFLAASLDASNYLDAQQITQEAGVLYSALTDRLLWWGEPANPSVVRVSQPGDAGLYLADVGLVDVSPNDGTRIVAVYEWRDAIYVAKENSTYRITPGDGDPATWQVTEIAYRVGAASSRAVAVGDDWLIQVHRSGIYLYDASAFKLISDELLGPSPGENGLWDRINWAAAATIWTHADAATLTIRIGLPLDGATSPNYILRLSYVDGFGPSIIFSSFSARFHYVPGRRYSLDTTAATQALLVDRNGRQVLLAGAAPSNGVAYPDNAKTTDVGVSFLAQYETGGISAVRKTAMERWGTEMIGLVQIRASGSGTLDIAVNNTTGGALTDVAQIRLRTPPAGDASVYARVVGEMPRIRITGYGPWRIWGLYPWCRPWSVVRPAVNQIA